MNYRDFFNLGNQYYQDGNDQMAIEMWNRCVQTKDDFGPVYLNMFDMFKKRNDKKNMLAVANRFADCPLTGRTIDIWPRLRAELAELTKPEEKKPSSPA